jgi:ankyrin repeat protein
VEESPPDVLRNTLRENPKLIDARMHRGRSSVSLLEFVIDLKDLEKVKAICDAGAKVDQNLRGNMPLMAAVDVGSVEILDELLTRGGDLKMPADYKQKSLLHYAILEGQKKVAARLSEAGLPQDFFTRCGMGNSDEVKKELEEDPSLGLLFDEQGNIPLTYAVAGDSPTVVRLLLDRDMVAPVGGRYRKTPMVLAVHHEGTEVLDLLLAHGMSPDVVSGEPLFSAMRARKLDHFRHLLDAKADVAVRQHGSTPLHFAVAAELPTEFGRMLLEHGANIEALTIAHDDPEGCGPPGGYPQTNETPLHLAGREMSPQWASLLLAAKARTSDLDTSNLTPLGAAIVATLQAEEEHQAKGLETIKAMIDGGCSVDVVDSKGKSVRDAIASVLRNPSPPPKAKAKKTDQKIFGRELPPYLISDARMGPTGLDATKLLPSPLVKKIAELLATAAK